MLRVVFLRQLAPTASGDSALCLGIEAYGHAEWDALGRDLLCAAVSVLLQSLLLACEEVLHVPLESEQRSGYLRLRWSLEEAQRVDLSAVVATIERSLAVLARQYPKHLRLDEKPVSFA